MTGRRAIGVVMLALALAGCASIPQSGPVIKGDRIGTLGNEVCVRVIARPPTDGMSQEALVRGFLSACASLAEGDETARQYLTDEASRAWHPLRQIRVYDAAALTVKGANDVVRVSAPLLGSLGTDRRYAVAEPGATIADDLKLTKVNGEWRIAEAPVAAYLSQSDLQRSYRVHKIFFLNDALDRVVPEYVMLPMSTPDITTALVQLLLSGPAESDGAALKTAIPEGTTLGFGGVAVSYSIATVPLSRKVLMATDDARRGLLAQIAWTLRQLPYVGSVVVNADGTAVYPQTGPTSVDSYNPTPPTPALTFVRDERAMVARGTQHSYPLAGYPIAEAVESSEGDMTIGVAAGRKVLYIERGLSTIAVAAGGDIASPTITPDGAVWFVDREPSGGLYRWTSDDGISPVHLALPPRSRVLDFSIAPDGSRIALVLSLGATASLRIGTIHSDATGFTVASLRRVEQQLTSVSGVAWMDDANIAVLGTIGTVALQPIEIALPLGTLTLLGGPANAVSLTADPGSPLVVADQAGQMWHLDAGKWTASELGTAPRYGN